MSEKIILVTGAGGGGGNNLIRSLKKSSLNALIVGSNMEARLLAKSNADKNFLLPPATEPNYMESLSKLVEREGIELVIPNSDREVGVLVGNRGKVGCRIFLPPENTVAICQDKYHMYIKLKDDGIPVAKAFPLEKEGDIDSAFKELRGTGNKFWVRLRKGSGSKGATWVKTPDQAKSWIHLWTDLRGFSLNDFTISEFLPGRDYAFQSVWKEGQLVVCKMCERLSYFMGANRLSGMSSTPEMAVTIKDEATLELIFKAIHSVCSEPHGNFCLDLKGDSKGVMNITEFNIGRFCMITPIFDLTGKINTAEAYVRSAFGEIMEIENPIDIEESIYLLRDLDTEPTIVTESFISSFAS